MPFIKLEYISGKEVYVNSSNIMSVDVDDVATRIRFNFLGIDDGDTEPYWIRVKGTPEEVVKLLENKNTVDVDHEYPSIHINSDELIKKIKEVE